MNVDLTGKRALVTGSSEGIGFAIADGLLLAGATVILNGRSKPKLDAAYSRLSTRYGADRLAACAADVSTAEGCDQLVTSHPEVDILVNNAAVVRPSDFFETPDAVWEEHWQTNVMAGVRLARAYLEGMATRQWGRVLFMSSESGFNIPVGMIHYGVSKTADIAVARGLAKRMAGTGVTVNSVLPGPTLSDGFLNVHRDDFERSPHSLEAAAAEFVMEHRPSTLLHRPSTMEEVANLVVYLASPLASATTGAAVRVDGGVIDTL